MKKHQIIMLAATGLLTACAEQGGRKLDAAAFRHQVDSLVGTRLPDITLRADEDLDRRKSIEVKVKADSIVAALTRPDTSTAQP